MKLRLSLFSCVLAMGTGSVIAQTATDQAGCQKGADQIAASIGTSTAPVSNGSFLLRKEGVATVYGECNGSLSINPDPEPFGVRLSPGYPNVVVRASTVAFDLKPAEVRQAIDACLKAAVSDPPRHAGRAGFARQRWRNSQMTGAVQIRALKWRCTYHGSERSAASVTISRSGGLPE